MSFRSVPKSVTLIDLERPSLRVISHIAATFGANCVKFAKLDPYCQQQKCSTGSLVFGNAWFIRDDACYFCGSRACCVIIKV